MAVHSASDFYDQERCRLVRGGLRDVETADVGDVTGRSLLNLRCHFGQDTLSRAHRGAARELAAGLHPPADSLDDEAGARIVHDHFSRDAVMPGSTKCPVRTRTSRRRRVPPPSRGSPPHAPHVRASGQSSSLRCVPSGPPARAPGAVPFVRTAPTSVSDRSRPVRRQRRAPTHNFARNTEHRRNTAEHCRMTRNIAEQRGICRAEADTYRGCRGSQRAHAAGRGMWRAR